MTTKLKIMVSIVLSLCVIFLFEAVLASNNLSQINECNMYVYGKEGICCSEHALKASERKFDLSLNEGDELDKDAQKTNYSSQEEAYLNSIPEWVIICISLFICTVIASITLAILNLKKK